jgi:hypothetical protein
MKAWWKNYKRQFLVGLLSIAAFAIAVILYCIGRGKAAGVVRARMVLERAKAKDIRLQEKQKEILKGADANSKAAVKLREKIALLESDTEDKIKQLNQEDAEAWMKEFRKRGY